MPLHAVRAARGLGRNLRPNWGIEGPWQWGTVSAVVLGSGNALSTVSVYLDNASGGAGATVTALVPYIESYVPQVGDVVLIGRLAGASRTQRVVMGSLATGNARPVYAGTVVFGPPLTGTYQTGDKLLDLTTYGDWVCTAGGSPGTWLALNGAVTSPKAPAVTVNVTGATTFYYAIFAEGKNGSTFYNAMISAATKITNSAASPNNTLNWTAPLGVNGALVPYGILRSTDGVTWSRLAFVGVGITTFTDNNTSGVAFTLPTFNPGGHFVSGGYIYRARARLTSAQTITANTFTKVNLDSVAIADNCYDPHGDFDTTNHWYVAPVSGWYDISGFVENASGATTNTHITYFVNGVERQRLFRQGTTGAPPLGAFGGTDSMYLNAGDQVSLVTYDASANAGLDTALTTSAYLAVRYLGS